MRTLIAVSIAGAALLIALPGLAGAQTSDTTVSFTIQSNGGLQISQTSGAATLSDGSSGVIGFGDGTTMTGTLPETTVTDARGDLSATWNVDVSATNPFTNGDDETVGLTNAHVYLDATSLTELTDTVLSGAITGMTVDGAELTADTNTLASTYSLINGTTTDLSLSEAPNIVYTPSIDVTVPSGTSVGTYDTVVTQTVS